MSEALPVAEIPNADSPAVGARRIMTVCCGAHALHDALNGTSSALYGSVPELVPPAARARAFGIFYTFVIGSGAVSPVLFGLVGDHLGITFMVLATAALALATIPLVSLLRPLLRP